MRAIARPTPLWEHMAFSIVLPKQSAIKGFMQLLRVAPVRPSGPTIAAAIVLALEGIALGFVRVIELL